MTTTTALATAIRTPAGELRAVLYPTLQLRSSGFAGDLVPAVGPDAAGRAAGAIDARAELALVRDAFRASTFPTVRARFDELDKPVRDRIVRSARLVTRGLALPDETTALLDGLGAGEWTARWARAVERTRRADEVAAHAHRLALAEVLDQVRDRSRAPRLRQAISQSNPGFARLLYRSGGPLEQGAQSRSAGRAGLATAHRYLRRFTMRCETVSFYGPTCFVELDPDSPVPVLLDAPAPERVAVDAAAWLVQELAALCGPRGRASLISRSPVWRLVDTVLERTTDGHRVPIGPAALELWRRLDTWRRLGDAVTAAGLSTSAAATAATELRPALRRGPAVPSTELRALRALTDAVPGAELPARVAAGLAEAERVPWPRREQALAEVATTLRSAGVTASRNAGDHYADRSFWHEERSSPFSERVRLGGPVTTRLVEVVRAVLEPCYLMALLTRCDARQAVRERLGGRRVPLAAAAAVDFSTATPRADRLRAALRDVVRGTAPSPDGAVRLPTAAIAAACAPSWHELTDADLTPSAALPGLDLLADGADPATAVWVIGEIHDDSSSVLGGSSARVHSDPDGLYRRFTDEVRRLVGETPMAGVVARRRTMHITPELPGLALELSGRSGKPEDEVRPISAAVVAPDGSAVEVDGERRWLYPGDLPGVLHRALSLPSVVPAGWADDDDHVPRLVVDEVVVSRARWNVELATAGVRGFEHWLAVQRLRRELGLPRHVFVRHPRETKPVHVDLDEPMAVEDVARLGPGRCAVTECLPAPDRLWWAPDGRQVCELRLPCLIDLSRGSR